MFVLLASSAVLHADVLRELLTNQVAPRRVSWSAADEMLWFSDEHQAPATVGFYDPATGQVQTFPPPCSGCAEGTARVYIEDIFGADGGAWFAWTRVGMDGSPLDGGMNSYLSWVTTGGAFTTFPVEIKDAFRRYEFGNIGNSHVVLRSDGTVLFTMNAIGHVGVLDPDSGEVLDKALSSAFSQPSGAALAPNGSTIIAMAGVGKLGEISLGNVVKEYQVPKSGNLTAAPLDVAIGPDGNIVFTDVRGRLGLFTNGSFLMAPLDSSCVPSVIAPGGSGEYYVGCNDTTTGSIGHVVVQSPPGANKFEFHLEPLPFSVVFPTFATDIAWTGRPDQQLFVSGFENDANALVDRLFNAQALERCGLDVQFVVESPVSGDRNLTEPEITFYKYGFFERVEKRVRVVSTGGVSPYTVEVLGSLPDGFEFDGRLKVRSTNELSPGVYSVAFRVTDKSTPPCVVVKPLKINVELARTKRRAV